jgi:hypothetical protein
MKVELFYIDDCPSWHNGQKNLEIALQEEGLTASIKTVKVTGDEDAVRLKFLGSPSFRIDDRELWPEERDNYSLSCRVYSTPEGLKGFPTVVMLRTALRQFKQV